MDNKQNNPTKKTSKQNPEKLTIKEKAFVAEYVKTGNATQSYFKAGYKAKSNQSAGVLGHRLLNKVNVRSEIDRIASAKEKKAIMDAQEVMELFSKIARGEVKDQFGLDASLNDRLKAMQEIAKRTVGIENRVAGKPDATISIKVDWKRE